VQPSAGQGHDALTDWRDVHAVGVANGRRGLMDAVQGAAAPRSERQWVVFLCAHSATLAFLP
jgi:hypothetical protein